MKQFVITGAARSGTGFIARVLTEAGVPCGHEKVFNPTTEIATRDGQPTLTSKESLAQPEGIEGKETVADSSWIALPWVKLLDLTAFHQIRHPLDCIRSLESLDFFEDYYRKPEGSLWPTKAKRKEFVDVVKRLTPTVFDYTDSVTRSLMYWILWNEKADEVCKFAYRIEAIDAGILQTICEIAGHPITIEAAEKGLQANKADDRKPGRQLGDLSWESFKNQRLVDRAKRLAEGYGYDV